MTLQELTCRLQSLCHDGYSMSEIKARVGEHECSINDVVFLLENEMLKNPIEIKLSEKEA